MIFSILWSSYCFLSLFPRVCFSLHWCRRYRALPCRASNLEEVTIHFQRIGCRFTARLSLPYSADGGGGAVALVITENCCVGENRCVNSMTDRWECVCVFGDQMHIRLSVNPSQPHSRSRLGQFDGHSQMSHTYWLPTVWLWFWPRVVCLPPPNIIQCHTLSTCPANVLKLEQSWCINLQRENV